ncbi:gluconokinase [Corynebacterium sp. A21]|uniref:gluconokinase n=1 Tax=Corynebacterium sp. A21 TaxID=3457318 RepID=UPI003FD45AA7
MGVSGSGKTTTGLLLSERLGLPYTDGDDLHPQTNIDKMAAGQPLNDEDRWPWLELIGRWLDDHPEGGVIGCSALKRSYRDLIREFAPDARFVHVHGDREVLWERMGHREGHFMPPELLDSQIAILEQLAEDESGAVFNVAEAPEKVAGDAAAWLRG